jgi:hypothetical protein
MLLTKTEFLIFRDCAHNAWLKIHSPEVYRATPLSAFERHLFETGNEVDVLARELFPGGILVTRGDAESTTRLVAARTPVLYQPVFKTDRYTTACDILVWNPGSNLYDLYEVKSSTSSDDQTYIFDLAFQAEVLRTNGVPLGQLFLMHLNSAYMFREQMNVRSLFVCDNLSDQVGLALPSVSVEMATAHEILQSKHELPPPCCCLKKGRGAHCTTFLHTNPNVPDYSVHDITRISQKKLGELIDRNIIAIEDVPDDFALNDAQKNQVRVAKTKQEIVDAEAIAEFVSGVQYPIAFLDYETYPCAIPRFARYHPYDHIPFQFSLDVIDRRGGATVHHEFLFTKGGCPDTDLLAALKGAMPASGSIITWNKAFERGINEKLSERNPDARGFLEAVNARLIDLMDVFSAQAYVHPGFKGKTSLKNILTVLVPSLSYDDLAIKEGATATVRWNEIVTDKVDPATAVTLRSELLRYCALDTRAMVEIWLTLTGMAGRRADLLAPGFRESFWRWVTQPFLEPFRKGH